MNQISESKQICLIWEEEVVSPIKMHYLQTQVIN